MDKNTLTGLLLMGLVLFGFMYCGRDSQTQKSQTTEQAAGSGDKSRTADATPDAPAATHDIFSALADYVRANGSPVASDSTHRSYALSNDVYNLVTDTAGRVSGTLVVDEVTYDIADLAPTSSVVTPDKKAQISDAILGQLKKSSTYREFAPFVGGAQKTITLSNKLMRVTFSSQGGMVSRVQLLNYKTETTEKPSDVVLFTPQTASYYFELERADRRISTADLNFKIDSIDENTVLMSLPLASGVSFGIKYTVVPDEYIVKMDIVQKGMDQIVPANRSSIKFFWHLKMARNELGKTFEERNSAIYYKVTDESPEYLSENEDDSESVKGALKWVAFKNQFFSSVIVPRTNFSSTELDSKVLKNNNSFLKDMSMRASLNYSSKAEKGPGFDFFFGPNEYSMLSSLDEKISPEQDLELTRLVPLGWGIFRWINKFIIIPVFNFLGDTGLGYGIIILLLTLFIKLILFPFTYKSYMSQAKMRVLAPEIKEINDKYPGQENAMKRQQETMKLYSKAGASPFSGCLPMLLQMPVLIAMFSFFPSAIELRGQSFLWVHDLSAPDVICTLPFSIPFYGDHVSLFCLLMTITNIIYARINMQNQPGSSSMPGMKWMMYLMPVMFLFFFNDYAAGLSYYYFLSLLITIVQTYIFRRVVNEDKVRAQMLENAKKPRKKTGFMAKLEAAQKRQEALMREQAKQNARRRR